MAKLIYFTPTSLDGYIADEPGDFDWAAPDEAARISMTQDVRDDVSLGDARGHSWADLASGR